MNQFSPTDLEAFVRQRAPEIAKGIQQAAKRSNNEADLVAEVEDVLKRFETSFDVTLKLERERTLINGRADAVYNRFVVEYEPPQSLRKQLSFRHNQHAIGQVKQYMDELSRLDRHRKERLAGVVLDGYYYIFVRYRDGHWRVDDPVPVSGHSTEIFLRYLLSLSTELALTPENLVRDFGENTIVSRLCVSTLYDALGCDDCPPRVNILFEQWQRQFGEISGWEKQSGRLNLPRLARNFGITERNPDPLRFFFSVHTYYATFIKLLAVQIATYYLMPKVGSGLAQVASSDGNRLHSYLSKMERGGIFTDFGIKNFLEGDFFGWYLDVWNEDTESAIRRVIGELANYSLVTLDVDPEETRDLLKKLYENLMPKALRHALGEYYTPDWLAERLLNQLGYDGDPTKRLLDPACGSGTFLVLAIKRIRQYSEEKLLPSAEVLEKVLDNIVGIDLNPLAIISSRTNYLLALGDLLTHRKGDVIIPVYLADSILTPSVGKDLFSQHKFSFNTAVGQFSLPRSLIDARYIDELANLLEESVDNGLTSEQFKSRLLQVFPLDEKVDLAQIEVTLNLYDQLATLENKGINGIWARIIKNAFAPLFQGKFDYIAGNPPWVVWQNLPENYREDTMHLWEEYKLFDTGNITTRQLSSRVQADVSVLMFYVAMNHYLRPGGTLGFVITQSLFRSVVAGRGFRRFELPEDRNISILHVDDFTKLKPFEGASNLTSVFISVSNSTTKYPVQYTIWRRKHQRSTISMDASLEEVSDQTIRNHFVASPIYSKDPLSPWAIGRKKALSLITNLVGRSVYQEEVRKGSDTRGANGVYWIEVVQSLNDDNLIVSNLIDLGRKKLDSIQSVVEDDLVYPLLRGRDVTRWFATPTFSIIVPYRKDGASNPISENDMIQNYPKSYSFLKYFEDILRSRPKFRNFDPKHGIFYMLYNVGDYTFSDFKVVWKEQANSLTAAVVSTSDQKIIIPDHKLSIVPIPTEDEAHYLCGVLNSTISQFIVKTYSLGTSIDTHVLNYLSIPKFEVDNKMHREVSLLAKRIPESLQHLDDELKNKLESDLNTQVAQLYGISNNELIEINKALLELKGL